MDLAEAPDQPVIDPDLGLVMVFNSAIYNYPELRGELESLGHRFFSGSNTEVLLKGYRVWGAGLLPRLNGVFAFVVWERDRQRSFPVCDHLGIKPFRYSLDRSRLRFAPSLPALLKGNDIANDLDLQTLNLYLNSHVVVPAPHTSLEDVRKLSPATWMSVDLDGSYEQHTWWALDYDPRSNERKPTFDDQQERILDDPRKAVTIRQRATCKVGVLLPGGVGSSLLVGLLREAGMDNLLTSSIGLENADGERGDEFRHSDLITERYRTRHHRLYIDEHEMIEQLSAAFHAMSEPMVGHDYIAFYLLAQEASRHCEVAQSDQGADKLLAGCHWYPKVDGADDAFTAYRAAFFDHDHEEYLATVGERFCAENVAGRFVCDYFASPDVGAAVDKALRLDSATMLVDDPVKRADNMTMAWGLEARVPFLDYRLAELPARIPVHFKFGDGGKRVLRDAACKVIPSEVIDRPKGYFPVPGFERLQGRTRKWVRGLLLDLSQNRGLLQPTIFDRLLSNPNGDLAPLRGSKLWQLAVLNPWSGEQGL